MHNLEEDLEELLILVENHSEKDCHNRSYFLNQAREKTYSDDHFHHALEIFFDDYYDAVVHPHLQLRIYYEHGYILEMLFCDLHDGVGLPHTHTL